MVAEAAGRPTAASQRERGVATCGSAEDADHVETQERCQPAMGRHPVDGLADLDRAPDPARRARLRGVLDIVARVLRNGHREATLHQYACQIDVDPGRPSRPMRDDDKSAVAAPGFCIVGP